MALTVTEKEHWKRRIGRRIAKAIEELVATSNPLYLKQVAEAARQEATRSLGIAELLQRQETIQKEKDQLADRANETVRELVATIRGVDKKSISLPYYAWDAEIEQAIASRQQLVEKQLLGADPLGRQVLKLRQEEEELLDTVWLATSSQQIRALWQSVTQLLDTEMTPLQQEAMKTPPTESDGGDKQQ